MESVFKDLPAKYVLHTVGSIIDDKISPEAEALLASCYRSCLEPAEQYDLHSIAFCCISTGVFRFPPDLAARLPSGPWRNSCGNIPAFSG